MKYYTIDFSSVKEIDDYKHMIDNFYKAIIKGAELSDWCGHGTDDINQLHSRLKSALDFPEYYGNNMDAFWDCITWDIEVPSCVYIKGVNDVPNGLKAVLKQLIDLLGEAVKWYADIGLEFRYEVID